jgi:hypothetical protein
VRRDRFQDGLEQAVSWHLFRSVWDNNDDPDLPTGRYYLGWGSLEAMKLKATTDFQELFDHLKGEDVWEMPLDFRDVTFGTTEPDPDPDFARHGELEAGLGDGSPMTWTLLEVVDERH